MKNYLILGLAIVLNASANIFIKIGVKNLKQTGSAEQHVVQRLMQFFIQAIFQPAFIFGIILFALALLVYGLVLTQHNLSVAYPVMVSLGLIIVVLASHFILEEPIVDLQKIGFILIIAGVFLVAKK